MNKYYYLDVSLELPETSEGNTYIPSTNFKKYVVNCVKELFGEAGASIDFDVLKYNTSKRRAILRVPINHYVKLRSSLTLAGSYGDFVSIFKVHKASPVLLNLLGDSREFEIRT